MNKDSRNPLHWTLFRNSKAVIALGILLSSPTVVHHYITLIGTEVARGKKYIMTILNLNPVSPS